MPIRDVLQAALRRLSWSQHEIDTALTELQEDVLTDPTLSDHTAYRELADAVVEQIGWLSGDGDSWDGDDDELTILKNWLTVSGKWLPEMYAHLTAEKIRFCCNCLAGAGSCDAAADRIDPWLSSTEHESWGTLVRKSDGTEVPWKIMNAVEVLRNKEK